MVIDMDACHRPRQRHPTGAAEGPFRTALTVEGTGLRVGSQLTVSRMSLHDWGRRQGTRLTVRSCAKSKSCDASRAPSSG
jgi:hypothetical protein